MKSFIQTKINTPTPLPFVHHLVSMQKSENYFHENKFTTKKINFIVKLTVHVSRSAQNLKNNCD